MATKPLCCRTNSSSWTHWRIVLLMLLLLTSALKGERGPLERRAVGRASAIVARVGGRQPARSRSPGSAHEATKGVVEAAVIWMSWDCELQQRSGANER